MGKNPSLRLFQTRILVLLLLHTFNAAVLAEDGLLSNGDFERSASGNGTWQQGAGEGVKSLDSWSIQGTVEYIGKGQRQGNTVPEGRHSARLGNDGQISQGMKVKKGFIYSLTFAAARTCSLLESLNVSVPPASRNIDLQAHYSSRGWDLYAWAFQALSDEAQVIFRNIGMEEDPTCGPIIDAIALKRISTAAKVGGELTLFLDLVRNGVF